jgi:hypothetical protein
MTMNRSLAAIVAQLILSQAQIKPESLQFPAPPTAIADAESCNSQSLWTT